MTVATGIHLLQTLPIFLVVWRRLGGRHMLYIKKEGEEKERREIKD